MYIWGGKSDVGFKRQTNEDYLKGVYLGSDKEYIFLGMADGAGSHSQELQPAVLVLNEIEIYLNRIYANNKELFKDNIEFFLQDALLNANRILGALKLGNDEYYAGYGSSVTCVIIDNKRKFSFAHAGNTRLYLMRTDKEGNTTLKQLTKDGTKAQELVDTGSISAEEYYLHPDKLVMTNGIGILAEPFIQSFTSSLKDNDVLLLTTDGIHNAIKPEAIQRIVLASSDCISAADNLILGSAELKYIDNASALLFMSGVSE